MFKVGDKVRAFGCDGVVISDSNNLNYPIVAEFEGEQEAFTSDGRNYGWHKEPSLVLIERPKQLVKKYLWAFIGYDGWMISGKFYKNETELLERNLSISKDGYKRIDSVFIEVEE